MRFVLVVVAAGSCDRSCQYAIAPNTFLREVPPPVLREQLCLVVADADVSGANSSRKGHSNQCVVQLTELGSTTASTVETELAQTGGISSCVGQLGSNNHRRILDYVVSFSLALLRYSSLLRCIFWPAPSGRHVTAAARHSANVFRSINMCHMIVASFRMTATRAILAPRLRLMRLNHSRIRGSFRSTL